MSDNQSLVADTAVPEELKQLIVMHLEELGKPFTGHCPDKDFQQYTALGRQPFSFDITTVNVNYP